jgi:hypothetical protein
MKTRKTSPPTSPVSPRPSAPVSLLFLRGGPFTERTACGRMRESTRSGVVLRIHLNQASHHDYGLRGHSETPTENEPIIYSVPTYDELVLQSQMHYMNHAARVYKIPFKPHKYIFRALIESFLGNWRRFFAIFNNLLWPDYRRPNYLDNQNVWMAWRLADRSFGSGYALQQHLSSLAHAPVAP